MDIRIEARNVKKDFIKSRFVDAVKSIIIEDGVSNVTVRKIAELTGYSYATIYHYFSNLNELLLEAKLSMIHDMVMRSGEQAIRTDDPLQHMKDSTRIPVNYFIENPNVFRFFYSYEMDSQNETAMRSLELEKVYYDDFLPFVEKGIIQKSEILAISRTILYAIFGMITLYLSKNGLSREEIDKDIDHMIDILLKGTNDHE
jgi:AcrR family transcriptional regulator